MGRLTERERRLLVTDAAILGLRVAAATYGVAPSAAHRWVHHPDYVELHASAKYAKERLAAHFRGEAWREVA
jgi:hypothetical protein